MTCCGPSISARRVRLAGWVQSQARSRSAAVHRSARSLRHHAVRVHARVGGVRDRRDGASSRASSASPAASSAGPTRTSIRRCRPALVEVVVDSIEVLSAAETLPFQVAGTQEIPEEQRLRYRFLDLRRDKIHANIVLRSKVISSIRRRMQEQGFLEFQTPILTSSSPEGARDYLVPEPDSSRQVLRAAAGAAAVQAAADGRRASIATSRSRRVSATKTPAPIVRRASSISSTSSCRSSRRTTCSPPSSRCWRACFGEFSDWTVTAPPFPRIAYDDAMAMYGSDKPDLRNPDQGGRRDGDLSRVGVRRVRDAPLKRDRSCVRFPRRAPPSGRAASSTRPSASAETLGLGGLAYIVAARRPRGRWRSICPRSGASSCSRRRA